jgi:hypothetical protein
MSPHGARAATASVSVIVLNGRTGLLHVTATGLPPNAFVWLDLVTQPIADPTNVVQYIRATTTAAGTIDVNDPTGVFICGTYIQLIVELIEPTFVFLPTGVPQLVLAGEDAAAVSPSILGHCPSTNPVIGISGVVGGVAQVSGQGFNVKEVVGVSVSSAATGFVTGVTVQTNDLGNFTATVPLGAITCPDTITPHANGLAGSMADGAPFAYACPTPSPTPTLTTVPPTPTATASPQVPQAAHLTLVYGPSRVAAHQLETIHVTTGLPNTLLRVVFISGTVPSRAFSVRTDNQGVARITYMAPPHVPTGAHVVHFTVSYMAGPHVLSQSGSFTVVG